jgi:hypothetical protein
MSGDEREEFELIDEVSEIRGLGRRKIGDEV